MKATVRPCGKRIDAVINKCLTALFQRNGESAARESWRDVAEKLWRDMHRRAER